VEIKSRSNALQHCPSFLGYRTQRRNHQIKVSPVGGPRTRTRLCAPGVWQQHPGHNLIGHPLPQLAQHRLVPVGRTSLQDVRLDVLVAYARNERLVAIGEPEELEGRPQLGVLDRRRDVGRRALRKAGERRGEELLEPARKGRGQGGEEMRLKVDDVGGRDGVAQPGRAEVVKRKGRDMSAWDDSLATWCPREVPVRQQKYEFADHIGVPTCLQLSSSSCAAQTKGRLGQTTHLIFRHELRYIVCDQILMAAHVL
jgi:hypothetical protein